MRRGGRTGVALISALVTGAVAGAYALCVAAQAAKVEAAKGDDLRPLRANAADVADGRRVADTACAGCHGANGISSMKDVPNLAGQRPVYLYLELKAYRSGTRGTSEMRAVAKPLNDQALVQLAAYYASLEPAQPGAAPPGKAAPAKPDPVQSGKTAAAACAGCHGETGVSKMSGTPSLVGFDPQYLVAAMTAYKNGQRKNDTMKSMLAAVSETDMGDIALYYALQKPARAQTPSAGDEVAGKAKAAPCALCHGDKGISTNPTIPGLAGQDAQYLVDALLAYKEGSRADETMKTAAASIDDKAAKDMAAFYASQQPQPTKVRKPLSIADWVQRCDRCHGTNGNSMEPDLPALAAQRQDYLEKVLHAYRTGARKNTEMAAMSEGLTEADVENLAAYYSRQKARSVVYVLVPGK